MNNEAFENACMEFDKVNLKPTYRILWGVPGSSHAIKIAERLGLPNTILGNACELYGAGSAEINEVFETKSSRRTFSLVAAFVVIFLIVYCLTG